MKKVIIGIVCVAVVAAIGVGLYFFLKPDDEPEDGMDYESDIILGDEEPLTLTSPKNISLQYKNVGTSADGKTVSCYIGNAAGNQFDLWLELTDDETGDVVYKSDLIPPGGRIETLELSETLEPGDHTLTLTQHQMEDDHATEHAHVNVSYTIQVR